MWNILCIGYIRMIKDMHQTQRRLENVLTSCPVMVTAIREGGKTLM